MLKDSVGLFRLIRQSRFYSAEDRSEFSPVNTNLAASKPEKSGLSAIDRNPGASA